MTEPIQISFIANDPNAIASIRGKIAIIVGADGAMNVLTRKINTLTKGAIKRLLQSKAWEKVKEGEGHVLAFPANLATSAVQVVKLGRSVSVLEARKAGAAMAVFRGDEPLTALLASHARAAEIAHGLALRSYNFNAHKTDTDMILHMVSAMVADPDAVAAEHAPMAALTEGVFFTRDLTNEPANILTTTEFAKRLTDLRDHGVEGDVLEEDALERLGMRTLLCVGQGSRSPSKVVIMRWNGGGDEPPFALVGKGVVFDTGGISLKQAGGMEDMTMDMGGAGVVAGVMRTLALRKAKANVVAVVGIVENMPDGNATRPGDVIKSMKGDTVEVINTDAEGRLVLADILWYTQEKYNPVAMVNLATLTGAVIIGLGHENAGVFSNDDKLCKQFLKSAKSEGEGAWRMPLGDAYDKLLKSRVADMKNIGGRAAGSITAAQFLQRFVRKETPWIHLDIAGVASPGPTTLAPKGATGWGVCALDRLIRDHFET